MSAVLKLSQIAGAPNQQILALPFTDGVTAKGELCLN